ncbi:MAG: hypothetical protein R3F11_27080 [Verrucomicrobiales bacterium]
MTPHRPSFIRRAAALAAAAALALSALCPQGAWAFVDDAYSAALEAAQEKVEKEGFKLREDYWRGVADTGKRVMVKHQLFKGNEYWFWLGTNVPDAELAIKIYDENGKAVEIETVPGRDAVAARILPPKTGTYYIAFVLKSKTEKKIDWALAYGYR